MKRPAAALLLLSWLPVARALPPAIEGRAREQHTTSALGSLLARADSALAAGDTISAIGYYRDAVSRAPRDPRGYVALGRAYLQVREAAHALEAFDVGMRSTQGSDELVLGLAEAYAMLGRPARALHALRAALAQGAASAALLEALATAAEHSGAFTEALAARRALLTRAREAVTFEASQLRALETRVSALELLVGGAERLGRARCSEPDTGPLLRALIGC
jgi:tetratricopeptide (TPR) repeat protein